MAGHTIAPFATAAAAAGCALALAACGGTRVLSTWTAPGFGGGFERMAVFVAAPDAAARREAEDAAAAALPADARAVAGHRLFPGASPFAVEDRSATRKRLADAGVDAALLVRPVAHEQRQAYIPPHALRDGPLPGARLAPPYGSLYSYGPYVHGYSAVMPAYAYETTRHVVEAVLFRVDDGEPVWTATTATRTSGPSRHPLAEAARRAALELARTLH